MHAVQELENTVDFTIEKSQLSMNHFVDDLNDKRAMERSFSSPYV